MTAEMVTRIIQTIIAPVVMVNACAIILGGLLNHSATINARLRGMARERLVIALAVVSAADWMTTAVLVDFLAGIGTLFLGVLLIMLEAWQSQRAIDFEVQRVRALPRS